MKNLLCKDKKYLLDTDDYSTWNQLLCRIAVLKFLHPKSTNSKYFVINFKDAAEPMNGIG